MKYEFENLSRHKQYSNKSIFYAKNQFLYKELVYHITYIKQNQVISSKSPYKTKIY